MSNIRPIGHAYRTTESVAQKSAPPPEHVENIRLMQATPGWKLYIDQVKKSRAATIARLKSANPTDAVTIAKLQSYLDMQDEIINITPESLARAVALAQSPGGQ